MSEADDLRAEVAALTRRVDELTEHANGLSETLERSMKMDSHLYTALDATASLVVVFPRVIQPTSDEDGEAAKARIVDLMGRVDEALKAAYNTYWTEDGKPR